ncbi:MAG: hypothetical protein RR630_08440 [Coprobacillus sp.]
MKTNIYETNYNAYQLNMLLDFTFSFEKDIAHDDICRTIIETHISINTDVLCIDGTKHEVNTNY